MLKLKKLKLSNIGRFDGEHVLDLDKVSGLVQVDAKNNNTGGSSGSGKTTVFNGLEYLLGVNALPSTVLQSRLTKSPMSVSGEFSWNGKDLVITRNKQGGYSIFLEGVDLVTGNNKMAEEKLDEILGVDRELLRKMIHKRQKEGGFFLGLTPKESHAFLSQCLDLKAWQQSLEKAEKDVKSSSENLLILEAHLASTKASLDSSQQALGSMVEPALDWDENLIPVLTAMKTSAEAALSSHTSMVEEKVSEIPKPEAPKTISDPTIETLFEQIRSLEAQDSFERNKKIELSRSVQAAVSQLANSLESMQKAISGIPKLKEDLEGLKLKISEIKQNKCPTCKQDWHTGSLELESLIEKAKKKFLEIQNAEALSNEVPAIVESISTKKLELAQINKEVSESVFKDQIQSLKAELESKRQNLQKEQQSMLLAYSTALEASKLKEQEIRLSHTETFSALSFDLEEKKKLLATKIAELDSFKKNKKLYDENKNKIQALVSSQEKSLSTLTGQKAEADQKHNIAQESVKIIRSYMNTMFQEALDSVADKATAILSRIPNMNTASVYFEGFKETKSGTVKEEINAILTMDGEIDIPVKSMSGGERTSIDLAIDLAVIDMIEEKAGKGLDLFILDEPFDGLDSICREQCLEILKTNISNKKIIIVDHSNETKEMVNSRIVVIRDGQTSRIDDSLS